MSTYYSIGCEKCHERQSFMSDGMAGFSWIGGATNEVPPFVEKHHRLGCLEHLRVFSEHDHRYDDFTEFDPTSDYEVPA